MCNDVEIHPLSPLALTKTSQVTLDVVSASDFTPMDRWLNA